MQESNMTVAVQKKRHSLRIDERKTLYADGVEKINSYDEYSASMETDLGTLLIGGKNLTVNEISTTSGEVSITGEIEYIQYAAKTQKGEGGFFKRLVR